jgi:sarcosine oxidase, subunit alpha
MRTERQPGEVLNRDNSFTFTFNGQKVNAYEGDSVVSALAANGIQIISRSWKYHRRRGVMTMNYHDPNCHLQVNDEPNVRAAHRKVQPGDVVKTQNVWPSVKFDTGAVNQLLSRFLTAGFYYKTFIKPQKLWPTYEKILAKFAGGGVVSNSGHHMPSDKRYAHPDVLVAGAGPAGMSAALGAAEAGARVMLVEEEYELGGHLRYGTQEELAALDELRTKVMAHPMITVMVNSVVAGRYDQNWISVVERGQPDVLESLVKVRATCMVVAPGLIERPYVFEGNDLPGVMLSTAVLRLVNLFAVKPGSKAVVFTGNDSGLQAAAALERAGVEVAKVVDAREGGEIVRAQAASGVLSQVELGDGSKVPCDLLVVAAGWTAPTTLLNLSGNTPVYNEAAARFVPGPDLPETVFATGGLVGDGTLDELKAHGMAIGTQAAERATSGAVSTSAPGLTPDPHVALFAGSTKGFVDFSEDVSSKDLKMAAHEGYDSVELLKRYTTATMGPAQGKLETINTVAILADANGETIEETGTTVWRPPYVPITLGALAGRSYEPVRYSPMQAWHEAHGGVDIVAGQWMRPEHYGDPAQEVRNVRESVGIIDVTPLGKFELRGKDIPTLLNFVYVNKWSKLDVGAVRYGVMCGEDGVVMDDGVTGRLSEDHYFMSTTSSGAASVHVWLENWLQTTFTGIDVTITSMTSAYASINIAGPTSRELLGRLVSDVDLSNEAFPYMNVRSGTIAGVPGCHMWRIGFTGELSFEIHVPAAYGQYVWEELMDKGADLGVAPFGLEAQRIMRLEKGHFIVGQDTDGVTQAFSADLEWLVKLDKDDFVGKQELAWQHESGAGMRLVAIHPNDPTKVPTEASQIVVDGVIQGRVTSSRFSPTLNRSICLGLVAPSLATPGTVVPIRLPSGMVIQGTVMEHHASYDHEGVKLRG